MNRQRIRHLPALAGLRVAAFALAGQAAATGYHENEPCVVDDVIGTNLSDSP